jgi:hypothetical protein
MSSRKIELIKLIYIINLIKSFPKNLGKQKSGPKKTKFFDS